jgi:hypothetical protein
MYTKITDTYIKAKNSIISNHQVRSKFSAQRYSAIEISFEHAKKLDVLLLPYFTDNYAKRIG